MAAAWITWATREGSRPGLGTAAPLRDRRGHGDAPRRRVALQDGSAGTGRALAGLSRGGFLHRDQQGIAGLRGGERAHYHHIGSGGQGIGYLGLDLPAGGLEQGQRDIVERHAGAAQHGGRGQKIGHGGGGQVGSGDGDEGTRADVLRAVAGIQDAARAGRDLRRRGGAQRHHAETRKRDGVGGAFGVHHHLARRDVDARGAERRVHGIFGRHTRQGAV